MTRTECSSSRLRTLSAVGRSHLAVVVTGSALLAAACGGSSSTTTTTTSRSPLAVTPIQTAIEQSIKKQAGVTTVVNCPTNVPRQAGYRFACTAALDAGTYSVNVRELNARGGVSYSNTAPLAVLSSTRIATAIENAVRVKRHLKATVTCPPTILQAKGLKFKCTAKTKKGTGLFLVTETDAKGHVSFIGL